MTHNIEDQNQLDQENQIENNGLDLASDELINKYLAKQQELELQTTELKDQLLRALAENDNLRRRYEKQIEENKEYALFNFLKEIIPVRDSFEHALSFKDQVTQIEAKNVFQGLEMTYTKLTDILQKKDIIILKPEPGQEYDPKVHEAIQQKEDSSYPEGSIIELLQVGYQFRNRLLRPAFVVVAVKSNDDNNMSSKEI